MPSKVMLASPLSPLALDTLRYPLMCSRKLDGIRATVVGGELRTRKGLLVPNLHTQAKFRDLPNGLDGELVFSNDWTAPHREVTSAVMSRYGEPDLTLACFDLIVELATRVPFTERYRRLNEVVGVLDRSDVAVIHQLTVENADALGVMFEDFVASGFEGAVTRRPGGGYKFGRSTPREQFMVKIKAFEDLEAVVLDVEEEMANFNPEIREGTRGSSKEGKVAKGRVGKLVCRVLGEEIVVKVGTGLTGAERALWWVDRASIIGATVTVKHQPPRGVDGALRFPSLKGVRRD